MVGPARSAGDSLIVPGMEPKGATWATSLAEGAPIVETAARACSEKGFVRAAQGRAKKSLSDKWLRPAEGRTALEIRLRSKPVWRMPAGARLKSLW